ncbi:MAG: large subunit ribosomal protein L11 [Flavobacteriaceae bacterium]|jgi:large subunit ribosomal protein L11
MAKKIQKTVKLQIEAGKAVPAPPLGPLLGQAGVNIGEFCTQFNEQTREQEGRLPVVLSVFDDRTFEFTIGKPLMSFLIKKTAGIQKGSSKNVSKKVATISEAQVAEIAEAKMSDLNANDLEAAKQIVKGTCRSMGVDVK